MKSEKGYTGVDIAIAIVVLFTLVSVIAMLTYNFNSSSKEIELKAKATELAITEIEKMKNVSFSEVENLRANAEYIAQEEIPDNEGFFRRVVIEDYADSNSDKMEGLVKKATVQIKYKFKAQEQVVELSTILTKGS